MEYVKIQNKGELDVRLISLMGGTTKSNNSKKIGQFGTGLKYTLAFLRRNNIDFRVFVGDKEVEVSSVREDIQGEEFNIIYIDGVRTSITDTMGLDWKAWMIIREIYCNALDEGLEALEVTEEVSGEPGKTTFYLQNVSEVKNVWDNWAYYFIYDRTPIHENSDCAIYPATDNKLKVYKQGVLIKEDPDQPSVFHYDLKTAPINELREYRGILSMDITRALCRANKETVEYLLERVDEDKEHYEASLEFSWETDIINQSWKEAIGNGKLITKEQLRKVEAKGLDIDLAGVLVVPEKIYEGLTKVFDRISELRVINKNNEFFEMYSEELDSRVQQALAILETCGYYINPELAFKYGTFGDPKVMAKVDMQDKEILLNERLVDQPLGSVINALVEENEHYRTGYEDLSRDFQSHFINMYVQELLKTNGVSV